MNALLAALGGRRVVSVIRAADADEAVAHVDALGAAGALDVVAVELTFTTPGVVAAIADAVGVEGALVGAGTVMQPDQASAAAAAGAAFLVAPTASGAVLSPPAGTLGIPGVATPDELHRVVLAGARAAKVFPVGSFGGPAHLRHLRVVSDLPLLASGGVRVEQVAEYLGAGATAVALSALTPGPTLAQAVAVVRAQVAGAQPA